MKTKVLLILVLSLLAACVPTTPPPPILVTLIADGRERTFQYTSPVTVGEFLSQASIELGDLDDVNPPIYTQISDGMTVTVRRITQETNCENQDVPYQSRPVLNEGLQPGEQRMAQAGQNGTEQICYRVTVVDGTPGDRVQISDTVLTAPQDEVIYVGPTGQLDPVPVSGTLAYISNKNAWIMHDSSTTKRALTVSGDLDPRVFSLSPDGHQLLFARALPAGGDLFNQLWLITDTTANADPVQLTPTNVLYADWVPGRENTISYSTADPQDAAPGWKAKNDLWLMRLDPQTGDSINVHELINPSGGGLYGWWGTRFQWSPDGQQLAWAQADGIGLVNLDTGELETPLLNYAAFNTRQPWSWRANLSWSPDNNLILTTVHGAPTGSEPAETSPAFHVAVTDVAGTFAADVVENAGIWSAPSYSPILPNGNTQYPQGYMAYLDARDLSNSINSTAEYDLYIADRDGSNAQKTYPPDGQPGLNAQNFVWSPDGHQIAFIYQGNLWIIDVESKVAHQLTLDGGASQPVWTP